MILDIIALSSISTFCIFLWFKTNFFYEYIKLLKLNKLNIFQSYEEFIKNTYIYFPVFLGFKSNFFAKLLSCPMCLNFWVVLANILIFKISLYYIGLIYVISLIEYMILSIILSKYEDS